MPIPLTSKVHAEHRLREFLRANGLPQPDEVEYGFACVRFLFHEAKACIVFDLDDEGEIHSSQLAAS